jgi:hypothetical protein
VVVLSANRLGQRRRVRQIQRSGCGKESYYLCEVVVPDDDAHCFSKLLDLNMVVMTGGRERTRAEFAALLNTAGYSLTRIIPTVAPQSVLEAIPS